MPSFSSPFREVPFHLNLQSSPFTRFPFALQERREREQQDLEFAKEMAEDDDDGFP